ncbi:MAG TPA: hypothetical protein PKC60_13665 [Hydrogenophaga sp.]|uniref:hypothetical protein n=1 Tax=Hydrogenophaga sp. TaxID=1904254 RepID=UPI002CAEA148|nr:hypothetical protein [Hydrogenophaga sp.]HMN94273.1 hypothetical protein [Hydrogenophaga sp.]HMP11015.1 hypothetical protein [Hydrogenophaga sp.]
MASDIDTVRVLRAIFSDMPRAPQGVSPLETAEWIQQAMSGFEGGEMAYTIEHITRSSMVDIVLRLREDGHLRDDRAFEELLQQLEKPEGRQAFMDWCIQAQKSVDATSRLLNRAKRSLTEPEPLFQMDLVAMRRFVAGQATGPGPLYAEFAARDDVRQVGVFEATPALVHEFDWGFIVEDEAGFHVYVAQAWRGGSVGSFERFMNAWRQETMHIAGSGVAPVPVPFEITPDVGIARFASFSLYAGGPPVAEPVRRWVGEVFLSQMLPVMAARATDPDYDFPLSVAESL